MDGQLGSLRTPAPECGDGAECPGAILQDNHALVRVLEICRNVTFIRMLTAGSSRRWLTCSRTMCQLTS